MKIEHLNDKERINRHKTPINFACIPKILLTIAISLAGFWICVPTSALPDARSDLANEGPKIEPQSVNLILREVKVIDSTVLSQPEIEEAIAPFVGKTVTFEALLTIQTRLTQLYVQKGYINSLVTLPSELNEELEKGIVIYRAVEGELEKVEIEGLDHLRESYIRERIEPYAAKPFNVYALEEGLVLLRENPLVENLESRLIEGNRPTQSQLLLKVEEAPRWRVEVEGSNEENPLVGEWGGKISLANQNLLGGGESLEVQYKRTEGIERFLVTSQIPINSKDGKIQLAYQLTDSEIIAAPFEEVGIRSEAQTFSLSVVQPVFKTPTRNLQLGLNLEYRESQSFILEEIPFSFESGVEDGELSLTALRFNQTYLTRTQQSIFWANSQFSFGFSNLASDRDFFSWQGLKQIFQFADTHYPILSIKWRINKLCLLRR